jgi:hypothetical protein
VPTSEAVGNIGRYFVWLNPRDRRGKKSRKGIKYMEEPSFDNGALMLAAGLSSK